MVSLAAASGVPFWGGGGHGKGKTGCVEGQSEPRQEWVGPAVASIAES